MYSVKRNSLTAADFIDIWKSVGWWPPSEEQSETALKNSCCTFGVYDDNQVIAVGRLIGDMAMSFYVKDFAVRPEYQSQGVGRLLMEDMLSYIKEQLPEGWRVSLELISSKGKEGFYSRFGFKTRPSDDDGAGMFMMIPDLPERDR